MSEGSNLTKVEKCCKEELGIDPPEKELAKLPDYDSPFAITSLEAFAGDKIIYIGEGAYGCTGCDRFHALLDKEWERVGEVDIPQWSGLHDYLSLFVRK